MFLHYITKGPLLSYLPCYLRYTESLEPSCEKGPYFYIML